MSAIRKTAGFATAAAAAALFTAGIAAIPSTSYAGENVKCYGVNACQGTGSCATAGNKCSGQNSCAGHGYVEMSAEACEAVGGRTSE